MANSLTSSRPGSSRRVSRRPCSPISQAQLQAYFEARETLRRLKPSGAPSVPPDPALRADPGRGA